MNRKKLLVLITGWFVFCNLAWGQEENHSAKEIQRLQAKIERLENTISLLRDENTQLKNLCKEAGINPNKGQSKPDISNKFFSFESSELKQNEEFNWLEILYKLKCFAIENGTIDTRVYHNHINKLESHHKLRLKVFDLAGRYGWYKDTQIFEGVLELQKRCHQRKLEYIKLGSIKAFDEVEEAEHESYKSIMDKIDKYIENRRKETVDNKPIKK